MDKRREIRFEKKRKEKELLALDRKMDELRNKAWEPVEYIEVKPIRDGFIRYFDLREDLKGRPDYKYLREILDKCNVYQFCRNRKFVFPKWYAKWNRDEFKLRLLFDRDKERLGEKAQSCFWKEEKVSFSGAVYNIWHPCIDNWMLVVKVKPHYIRYFAVFDNEAESEYQKLCNRFRGNHLWPKLDRLYGYGKNWDEWDCNLTKKKSYDRIVKKEMKEEAENFFKKE